MSRHIAQIEIVVTIASLNRIEGVASDFRRGRNAERTRESWQDIFLRRERLLLNLARDLDFGPELASFAKFVLEHTKNLETFVKKRDDVVHAVTPRIRLDIRILIDAGVESRDALCEVLYRCDIRTIEYIIHERYLYHVHEHNRDDIVLDKRLQWFV